MSLRLERAALLELLPDPTHRGHAKAEKLRDFAGALALFIELQYCARARERESLA